MRVLVVEAIAPEGLAYLREHGVDVDELAKASPAELRARLPDYEGLITRSGTAVTAELLDHAPRLRIVGRAGVGVDNVDVEACSRRGIVVCNAPYGNVVSAAEHTLGMLLALVRRIPEAHARLKALEWNRGIYGAELYRKTVGVVGLGKVGSRVAVRLRGFETDVVVYDPYIPESRAKDLGARQLVAFRDGGLVEHAVNIPLGDPAAVAELRPFVALADRLGRFSVQLDPEPLERLEVTLAGAIAEADPELLARAVLAGLLAPVMAGPVNLVNARLVAAERGVEVHVTRETETAGYTSVLTITTHTRGGRKIIAGTVFDGQPRIVRLRDLDIEFTPEGHILVLSYDDRPGIVGHILQGCPERVRRHPPPEGAHVPRGEVDDHRVAHGQGGPSGLSQPARTREPRHRAARDARGQRLAPRQQHERGGPRHHPDLREGGELARGPRLGGLVRVFHLRRGHGKPRPSALQYSALVRALAPSESTRVGARRRRPGR